MTSLEELLTIDGVAAAGEFAADGRLVNYKANMDMSPEMAAGAAQFCATVTMLFNTLAGAFSQMSGMSWTPQQGWAYSGGEWTVALGGGGYRGVFVETAKADFNKLFELLVGQK
jgi:roadblock/LC7 domain-containing protein